MTVFGIKVISILLRIPLLILERKRKPNATEAAIALRIRQREQSHLRRFSIPFGNIKTLPQ